MSCGGSWLWLGLSRSSQGRRQRETAARWATLPRDMFERSFEGPFNHEELRARVSTYVGEKLAGQEVSKDAQLMDIGQFDTPNEGDEHVKVVQCHKRQQRGLKPKPQSHNGRKSSGLQTAVQTQPMPRGRKPESEETRQSVSTIIPRSSARAVTSLLSRGAAVCSLCGFGFQTRISSSGHVHRGKTRKTVPPHIERRMTDTHDLLLRRSTAPVTVVTNRRTRRGWESWWVTG